MLPPGTRLGPYEILGSIGAGGMGEVYRARDTRLDRAVAVKILPRDLASDPARRARFEREARAISALNHPNVCTLHDVGHDGGTDYIVLELCEGKTLQRRIAQGPLPVAEAVEVAIRIADALEKAHRLRIFHRDLKPANIMVTPGGVKLLDFGLAELHEEPLVAESSASTGEDVIRGGTSIAGTLRYMPPEVLTRSGADARSDLFALGLILHEMVTGRPAFEAETPAELIAEILERQPADASELNPDVPPELARVIRACLAKDPEDRIQTAHDVKLELQWLQEGAAAAKRSAGERRPKRRSLLLRRIAMAAGALAVATLGIVTLANRGEERTADATVRAAIDLGEAPPIALGRLMPRVGSAPLVALSHDGSMLVYVGVAGGKRKLMKRRLDRFEVEPVAGTEDAYFAFFSPDDAWIGFLTDDKLKKVPVGGGSPVTVADANVAIRASWLEDGSIAIADDEGFELVIVPEGGSPRRVADFGRRARISDIRADGRAVLVNYREGNVGLGGVGLWRAESPGIRPLIPSGMDARFAAPGRLVFARDSDLYEVGFDERRGTTTGEPTVVQTGIATESLVSQAHYATSPSGTLAYVPGFDRSLGRIASVDAEGRAEFLEVPTRAYGVFDLSPDGSKLALEVRDLVQYLWVFDLARREGRRIPTTGDVLSPRWMPDGRSIVAGVRPRGEGMSLIVRIDPARMDETVVIHRAENGVTPTAISPDGRFVTFYEFREGGVRTGVVATEGGSPVNWLEHDGWGAQFSEDGRWIAYASARTGVYEIWLQSLDEPDRAIQISLEGGVEPIWNHAERTLYYRNGASWYAVAVTTGPEPAWDPPRLVWETDFIDTMGVSYDVSSDGGRLLISARSSPDVTDRIHLIHNWQ